MATSSTCATPPVASSTKAGLPPLACRSLETFSGEGGVVDLSDPDATLVRYTAGVDAATSARKRGELLAPAIEAGRSGGRAR